MGRRTVDLEVPSRMGNPENGNTAVIASVEDARVFENKPSIPSIPSIDGDVNSMSEAQKSKMIGRQRNSYGGAMGDVALPEGESVQIKTRKLVEEGLKTRGYSVSDDPESDFTIAVRVDEFWGWFSPGMWTVSFEAKITCTVTMTGQGRDATFTVKGYGLNKGQVASDANWQLAYSRAFDDFQEKFQKELEAAGL